MAPVGRYPVSREQARLTDYIAAVVHQHWSQPHHVELPNTVRHTGNNESFNKCGFGLKAGVQYAPLQWPQFECQLTVQVRAGNIE